MGPCGAGSGRGRFGSSGGRVRAEWGLLQGQGPRGAGSGLGPVRAEWGWGGVGHALTLRLALATRIGQVGPSRAG